MTKTQRKNVSQELKIVEKNKGGDSSSESEPEPILKEAAQRAYPPVTALDVTYLNIPFSDKDGVRALGAWYDANGQYGRAKKWYFLNKMADRFEDYPKYKPRIWEAAIKTI